jgi:hypothetical protein
MHKAKFAAQRDCRKTPGSKNVQKKSPTTCLKIAKMLCGTPKTRHFSAFLSHFSKIIFEKRLIRQSQLLALPIWGRMRQCHFAGTNHESRSLPETAMQPKTVAARCVGRFLSCRATVLDINYGVWSHHFTCARGRRSIMPGYRVALGSFCL